MKRLGSRGVKLLLIAVFAVVAIAVPAYAAGTWHPISGTVYEYWSQGDNGWYYSSNYRYVSTGGSAIKVIFNDAPTHGVAFKCQDVNTGLQIGQIVYGPPLGTTLTISGTRPQGEIFINVFRHEVSCRETNSKYTFSGSEYY